MQVWKPMAETPPLRPVAQPKRPAAVTRTQELAMQPLAPMAVFWERAAGIRPLRAATPPSRMETHFPTPTPAAQLWRPAPAAWRLKQAM